MSTLEPIAAGMIVSILNKYCVSGQFYNWLQQCCEQAEQPEDEHDEKDDPQWSSTTTTVSDASMHVHVHTH